MKPFKTMAKALRLSPQAKQVFRHMEKAGSISAREAMFDLDMTGNTLSRRITDIENAGIKIERSSKVHPTTQKRYTRYSLKEGTPS